MKRRRPGHPEQDTRRCCRRKDHSHHCRSGKQMAIYEFILPLPARGGLQWRLRTKDPGYKPEQRSRKPVSGGIIDPSVRITYPEHLRLSSTGVLHSGLRLLLFSGSRMVSAGL